MAELAVVGGQDGVRQKEFATPCLCTVHQLEFRVGRSLSRLLSVPDSACRKMCLRENSQIRKATRRRPWFHGLLDFLEAQSANTLGRHYHLALASN